MFQVVENSWGIKWKIHLDFEVLNLSPWVTLAELNAFFSYCGTIDMIKLQRNKEQLQSALVTFRQPYAYKIALLLNDAIFAGQPIRIFPLNDLAESPILTNETMNNELQGFISAVHAEVQAMANKGLEMLKRTKDEIEENYKLSEKTGVLVEQTRSTVYATEQAARHTGNMIMNYDYVSSGATWLSGVLDKASKCASELGTGKRDNANSRKRK